MNILTYANSAHDLGIIKENGLSEIILTTKELSRLGTSSYSEIDELASMAKKLELKVILEWDILICESDFDTKVQVLRKIDLSLIDVIRVQDLGALEFVLENTDHQIQLITDSGNHNLVGLKYFQDYIGKRLDRLIISSQLPKDKISEYCHKLDCDIEVLGLGPILLFYSPRYLLSPLSESDSDLQWATGESEESPHKGFPIVQNSHGTFMYHIKDLNLLKHYRELKEIGVHSFRFDFRQHKSLDALSSSLEFINERIEEDTFKRAYGRDYIRGYFNINKSNVLFKKLKNHKVQREDTNYIGEVIEGKKNSYIALKVKGNSQLSKDDAIYFITPEGKRIEHKVNRLTNTAYHDIECGTKNDLVLLDYRSGVWNKSQVYLAK